MLKLLLLLSLALPLTANAKEIIEDSGEGFDDLVDEIHAARQCHDPDIDVTPFLAELEKAPISDQRREDLKQRLLNVNKEAYAYRLEMAETDGDPGGNHTPEAWVKYNCFGIVNDTYIATYGRINETLRNNTQKALEEVRSYYGNQDTHP